MSWKIKTIINSNSCPHLTGQHCEKLVTEDGMYIEKCNEDECPLRVIDDDEEAEKMIARSD